MVISVQKRNLPAAPHVVKKKISCLRRHTNAHELSMNYLINYLVFKKKDLIWVSEKKSYLCKNFQHQPNKP